jgi:outer membrane protein assembly factor BamB
VLASGILAVNWDHEEQSFVAAFAAATGKELWRTLRDELTSWASPIVVKVDGREQLIVSGTGAVRGYDLKTGETIWEAGGLSANVVASPVGGRGIVIVGSSYEKQAMMAFRLAGAKGNLDETDHILWRRNRSTPYVPSPLLYDEVVYFLRHYQNVMSRVGIESGKDVGGPFRLGELRNIYASPVGADGRIYVTSREGLTIVITHAEEPELLAINELEDSFSASAALVGRTMYLRGEKFLYAIEEPDSASATGESERSER